MRKVLIGGLCASLIAGLTACNDKAAEVKAPETAKTATAAAVTQALGSGIEFANFDKAIRPQDDFYKYVNGTWLKNTEIPADRTSIGAFYDLREKSRDDVKAIIEEVAATPNLAAGTDEQKVADLYRSFMDTETLNKLGVTPIQGEFDAINALKDKNELVKYFAHSQIAGAGTPIAFYIDIDAKNSSRYATHLYQYGLSLPEKDYYFNESERFVNIRKAYVAHIEKMFTLAGLANPKASAEAILALETAIAAKHWDVVENRDSTKTYNLYQVKDLPTLAPDIDWAGYLAALGADKQTDIIVNQPSYIQGLNEVLKTTELATWKTYMQWQVLTHAASNLSEALDNENFAFFSKTLNGQEEQEPRWKRGVAAVNGVLGEVVGKVYVKRHFTPEAKDRMQALVENLRGAYGDSIKELT